MVHQYQDSIAIASFGAMEKGVVFSSSAGNEGLIGTLHNRFPAPALVSDLPLIFNKTFSSCNSIQALSKDGNGMAICENGSVSYQSFYLSQTNAAAAAIFISNDLEKFESTDFTFPGVRISSKDASSVINYSTKGKISLPA